MAHQVEQAEAIEPSPDNNDNGETSLSEKTEYQHVDMEQVPDNPNHPHDAHDNVSPINASWQKGEVSAQDKVKITKVLAACRDRDLAALARLATSQGGLIEDEVRRTACTSSHSLSDSAHARSPGC